MNNHIIPKEHVTEALTQAFKDCPSYNKQAAEFFAEPLTRDEVFEIHWKLVRFIDDGWNMPFLGF